MFRGRAVGRALVWAALVPGLICGASAPRARAAEAAPAPTTIFEWLRDEHVVLRRYLAVVLQAEHDYRFGYKTPALLMPVAIDLFGFYLAPLHEMEERFLYPVLRERMDAGQLKLLALIEHDQQSESRMLKGWQEAANALGPGGNPQGLVEHITGLAQLLNRHVVLQENHLFPVLDALLEPDEQQAILKQIRRFEVTQLDPHRRERVEALLAYIERAINELGGRIW